MSETRVVHCKKEPFDIYIGRPSIGGNPFVIGKNVATREEAIAKHKEWVRTQPWLLNYLKSIKGKTLGCWCKPKTCHGDNYVELIEELGI